VISASFCSAYTDGRARFEVRGQAAPRSCRYLRSHVYRKHRRNRDGTDTVTTSAAPPTHLGEDGVILASMVAYAHGGAKDRRGAMQVVGSSNQGTLRQPQKPERRTASVSITLGKRWWTSSKV
jgi:hypothetical protein